MEPRTTSFSPLQRSLFTDQKVVIVKRWRSTSKSLMGLNFARIHWPAWQEPPRGALPTFHGRLLCNSLIRTELSNSQISECLQITKRAYPNWAWPWSWQFCLSLIWTPHFTSCSQIYQQDIIARNFIDVYGKKQIYQVFPFTELVIFVLKAKGYFNTPSYLAWAFQSGSPLKPDFDRVILKLSEVHRY